MVRQGSQKSDQEKKQRFRIHKLKFRKVKTWVLIVAVLLLLFVDATLMRMEHVKMTELRDAVLAADQREDDEAIQAALDELREYAFSHNVINVVEENGQQRVTFGTGPFYLEHKYIRDANAALAEAASQLTDDSNPNGNVYLLASQVCQPQAIANGWSWTTPAYISCMTSEIQKYPASEELNDQVKVTLPSTELYRMNFASPVWAPTVTGFCILITVLLIVVIFIRVVIWIFLRISLLFL